MKNNNNKSDKEYRRARRQKLKSLGLCYRCGEKTSPNKTRCKLCIEKENTRKENLLKQNLCIMCGKKELFSKQFCKDCRDKYVLERQKTKRDKLKLKNLCTQCGKRKLFTATQCKKCSNKHKQYQKNMQLRYKESGLCVSCGDMLTSNDATCVKCKNRCKTYKQTIKNAAFNAYGGYICVCCGETEPLFLTIDHINNDGATMRKKHHGTSSWSLHKWLSKNNYPSGYQILCWNCNCGKYKNGGICPHELKRIKHEPN